MEGEELYELVKRMERDIEVADIVYGDNANKKPSTLLVGEVRKILSIVKYYVTYHKRPSYCDKCG